MSKAIVVALALLVGLAVGLGGCGGNEGGGTAAKGDKAAARPAKSQDRAVTPIGEGGKAVMAKTPMEAWLNFNEPLYTGDTALALSSFVAPAEAREMVAMGTMSIASLYILRREMAAAYGEKALEGHFKGVETEPFDRKKLEARTTITVDGDKAVATLDNGHKVPLLKKDGVWYVDMMKEEFPTGDEAKKMLDFDTARVFSVNFVRPKIGTPVYPTAESILELMQTAAAARSNAGK
jgi:hypothetical protein